MLENRFSGNDLFFFLSEKSIAFSASDTLKRLKKVTISLEIAHQTSNLYLLNSIARFVTILIIQWDSKELTKIENITGK